MAGKSQGVSGLVDSIRQHKNFKRLAGYAIQCLDAVVSPPRVGWEENSKQAFELGAVEAIAAVLEKHAADPEIYSTSVNCLAAIASFPRYVTKMFESGALKGIVEAFLKYWEALVDDGDAATESGPVERTLNMLHNVLRQSPEAFVEVGAVAALLKVVSTEGKPPPRGGAPVRPQSPAVLLLCAQNLERASRAKAAQAVLTQPASISTLVTVATIVNKVDTSSRRAIANHSVMTEAQLNAHLEFGFRALDRLSRTETGLGGLRAMDAVSALAGSIEPLTFNPAVRNLAVRLLGRILGKDLGMLLVTVAGTNAKGEASTPDETLFAASLLASLSLDDETVETLVGQRNVYDDAGTAPVPGGNPERLIPLLTSVAAPAAAMHLINTAAHIAARSSENRALLMDLDIVRALFAAMDKFAADDGALAAALNCLATLTDSTEALNVVDAEGAFDDAVEVTGGVSRVMTVFASHATSPAVAQACMSLLEHVLFYGGFPDALVEQGAAEHVVAAMRASPEGAALQLVATRLAIYLAETEGVVGTLVTAGIIPTIISNLYVSGSTPASSGMSAPATPGSAPGTPRGGAGSPPPDAAGGGGGAVVGETVLAELASASLYVLATVCSVAGNVEPAREAGCIRGVLAAFSRHSENPTVYSNFREVIELVVTNEQEVVDAVSEVNHYTRLLQELHRDTEAFRRLEEELPPLVGLTEPSVTADARRSTLRDAADQLNNSLCLVEAVSVSPRYVIVICERLRALMRVLGVVPVLKGVAPRKGGLRTSARMMAAKEDDSVLTERLQEEILTRTASTLSSLARVALEVGGSHNLSAFAEERKVDEARLRKVPGAVFARFPIKFVTAAITSRAAFMRYCTAAVGVLSLMSSGAGTSDTRAHVDLVVQHGGVEACVSAMRAHQNSMAMISAVSSTLTRIAGTPKGATAVATRGASRQIMRTIPVVAALPSREADAVLLTLLRVMDAVASRGEESAEILRKQGLVDVVLACTDIRKVDPESESKEAEGGSGARAGAGSSKPAGGAGKDAAGGSGGGGGAGYTPDPAVRAETDVTVVSILSKLVNTDEVKEAIDGVKAAAEAAALATASLADALASGAPPPPTSGIKLAGVEPGALRAGIKKLGMLADTEAARRVGSGALDSGAAACVSLAGSALTLVKARAAAEDAGSGSEPTDTEAELVDCLPMAVRTVRQILAAMAGAQAAALAAGDTVAAEGVGRATAVSAVPVLVDALTAAPNVATETLHCLAVLTRDADAAAAVAGAGGGRGVDVVVAAARRAGELGDEPGVAAAMQTLVAVGGGGEAALAALAAAGAGGLAQTVLGDVAQEGAATTVAPTLELLGMLTKDAGVAADAVSGGLFLLLRTCLARFCGDASKPSPPMLASVAAVLGNVLGTPAVVGSEERLAAAQDLVRRVVRAAMSSPAYLDDTPSMCAALRMIVSFCSPADGVPADVTKDNKTLAVAANAEDLVVKAMSSTAATEAVLALGSEALQALGVASRLIRLTEEVTASLAELAAASSTSALRAMRQLVDTMRNVSAVVAAADQGSGDDALPHATVFETVEKVVAFVKSQSGASADEQNLLAELLASCAQTTGRLVAAGALTSAHPVGVDAVVGALQTATVVGGTDPRVVEGVSKAMKTLLGAGDRAAVEALVSSGAVASLASTLQAARALGESPAAESSTAVAAAAAKSVSLSRGTIRAVLAAANANMDAFVGAGEGTANVAALTDLIVAATSSSARPSADLQPNADEGDLQDTLAAMRVANGGAAALWDTLAAGVEFHAHTRHSFNHLPKLHRARALHGMVAALELTHGTAGAEGTIPHIPGNVARLRALFAALDTAGSVALAAHKAHAAADGEDGGDDGGDDAGGKESAPAAGAGGKEEAKEGDDEEELPSWKAKFRRAVGGVIAANQASRAVAMIKAGVAAEGVGGEDAADAAAKERYSSSLVERTLRLLGAMNTGDSPSDFDDTLMAAGNTAALRRLFEGGAWGAAPSALRTVGRLAGLWNERQPSGSDRRRRVPGKLPTEVKPAAEVAMADVTAAAPPVAPGSPGALPVPAATAVPAPSVAKRVDALAKQGVFAAAAAALAGKDTTQETAEEVVLLLAEVTAGTGQTVESVGLDKASLQALQTTVRRFGHSAVVAKAGTRLVAALGEVYTEQSGKAFEDFLRKAVAAFAAAKGYKRHFDASAGDDGAGAFYFACPDGSTTWEAPAAMLAAVETLFPVDRMARFLEDDAVTAINEDVIKAVVGVAVDHLHDACVAAALASGLAKVAGNGENLLPLAAAGAIPLGVSILSAHVEDVHACESVTHLLLPFSFNLDFTKQISAAGAVPILTAAMERHLERTCPKYGSPLLWEPAEAEAERQATLKEAPNAARLAKLEPRTTQACVQCIANLACDNEPGADGMSTVDKIVAADSIRVLGAVMNAHLERPRLLEDAMCALSNIAFVSDDIRLKIGRSVTSTVVEVTRVFNQEPYLFGMALRAVGNLTRCDENIMRVVGFGVIKGIVEGMAANKDIGGVLQLAADVVGNLGSLDEEDLPGGVNAGIRAMKEGLKARKAKAAATGVTDSSLAVLDDVSRDDPRSLKVAVARCLLEDGAAEALMAATAAHQTNTALLTSCLRALFYMGDCPDLVVRMTQQSRLAENVIFVMRGADYDVEVLRRGARVLGQIMEQPELVERAMAAGAVNVLLSAVDTHKADRDLAFTAMAVLSMATHDTVIAGVKELGAAQTVVGVLRENAYDQPFVQVLLGNLMSWAKDAGVSAELCASGLPVLLALVEVYADNVRMLVMVLQLMKAFSEVPSNAENILMCGALAAVSAIVMGIVEEGSDSQIRCREAVLACLHIVSNIASTGPASCTVLDSERVPHLLAVVRKAYGSLKDPQGGSQPLTDVELTDLCDAAHKALVDNGGGNPSAAAPKPHGATPPGAGDPGWAPDEAVITRAVAMLLSDNGVPQLLWFGAKGTSGSIKVTDDRKNVVLFDFKVPEKRKKPKFPTVTIPMASIVMIESGLPPKMKKKLFGKTPVAERSIVLSDGSACVAHVQSETTGERVILEAALRRLCSK